MKLAFVMDPISKISYRKDSTLAMMIEAQEKKHEIFYIEPNCLFFDSDKPFAEFSSIFVKYDESNWYEKGEKKTTSLNFFDAILMRQDPPFNMDYINNTYILEAASKLGVKVFNDPKVLRDNNEKLAILDYPSLITDTIVSSSKKIIKDFIDKNSEVVIKPLGLMGGEGIRRFHREDTDLLETLDFIDQKKEKMMVQKFIPEVFEGDKRVILISGEDCGFSVTRIPQGDDFRGNLAVGGKAEVRELNDRDFEIVNAIKPKLIKQGILVAGIDILGSFLTEINITSPTCFRELYDQQGINLAKDLIEQIEKAF
jgi:glutathione synthase